MGADYIPEKGKDGNLNSSKQNSEDSAAINSEK